MRWRLLVGIVVDDLAAATECFIELGRVLQGEWTVEGRWIDRVVGLEGVRADGAMMQTPDGNGRLELVKLHSPSNQGDNRHAPASTPGIRHVAFAVEDIDAVVAGLRARGAELVGDEEYRRSVRVLEVHGHRRMAHEVRERALLQDLGGPGHGIAPADLVRFLLAQRVRE